MTSNYVLRLIKIEKINNVDSLNNDLDICINYDFLIRVIIKNFQELNFVQF